MRRVMALWGVKWPRRRYARLDAYLFATTLVNRLQAVTDLENQAEQRVLERLGFRREGVLRGLASSVGGGGDGVLYAQLRGDLTGSGD